MNSHRSTEPSEGYLWIHRPDDLPRSGRPIMLPPSHDRPAIHDIRHSDPIGVPLRGTMRTTAFHG